MSNCVSKLNTCRATAHVLYRDTLATLQELDSKGLQRSRSRQGGNHTIATQSTAKKTTSYYYSMCTVRVSSMPSALELTAMTASRAQQCDGSTVHCYHVGTAKSSSNETVASE